MKQTLLLLVLLIYNFCCAATTYKVGPGQAYQNISDVPLESLQAGDSVLIYYRATPYQEKFVIAAAGTELNPVVISGVPSENGNLPVIEGNDAITRQQLDFWSEVRGIIKVGGSSVPADNASWIVIENLDVRSARPGYYFTDDAGNQQEYAKNASAIYIEKGSHITIRNCHMHDCGNGLFIAWQSSDVVIEYNKIYDNGIENSIYEHNSYCEAAGITYQFNHYGPLRTNCPGNNLKDRSAGTVIRYNKIDGGNRQLDLVESDHSDLLNMPEYNKTLVYGNLLIEREDDGNSQVCHYGGDLGNEDNYRKGLLHFYHNTVISYRTNNTTLLRLSSNDEKADVRNNVIYTVADGNRLAISNDAGTVELRHNWLNEGWRNSHSNQNADVQDVAGNITGSDPQFENFNGEIYTPATGALLIQNAGALHSDVANNYPPLFEPIAPQRQSFNDIGAFESDVVSGMFEQAFSQAAVTVFPNPFTGSLQISIPPEVLNYKVAVFDYAGRTVFEQAISSETSVFVWQAHNISPGVYMVRVTTSSRTFFCKVVKSEL